MTSWFLLVPLLSRAGAGAGAVAEQLSVDRTTTKLLLQQLTQETAVREGPGLYGCGGCLANLQAGAAGTLQAGAAGQGCLWLLHTARGSREGSGSGAGENSAEHRLQVRLTCDEISLPPCRPDTQAGLDTALIVSPDWQLSRSLLYCGAATARLGTQTTNSTDGRMAVIFRRGAGQATEARFSCRYEVLPLCLD